MPRAILIFTNGVVLTQSGVDGTALASDREGRIIGVGSDAEIESLAGPNTKRVNLNGRALIPGFFDCHMHILDLGLKLGQQDLSTPPVASISDILDLLKTRLKQNPGVSVLLGNRYDQNKLAEKRHPTASELDQVTRDIPIRLEHTSGHAAVCNSKALEMLGIDSTTPNPAGGEIEHTKDGKPTGLLLETACWENQDRIVPEPTEPELQDALKRAGGYLLERGITSASDAACSLDEVDIYKRGVFTQGIRQRLNLMMDWAEIVEEYGSEELPKPQELQPAAISGHQLHVGQAKLFSDGAITTRTCWLTQPFEAMPDNYGIPIHQPDKLRNLIIQAHRRGWQLAVHAIGDRAIETVLDSYAEAQRQQTRPRPDHRIEHCMLLNPDLIARLRRQNVWTIGQPEFISSLGDAYITALGRERADRINPYATLDSVGAAVAFSSDCPVVPGSPLAGLYAAMARRTPMGQVLNARECLNAETALYAYTAAPAYATRTDTDRGTLEAGKWADMVILSRNPLTTNLEEWKSVEVDATFIAGECLYGEEKL